MLRIRDLANDTRCVIIASVYPVFQWIVVIRIGQRFYPVRWIIVFYGKTGWCIVDKSAYMFIFHEVFRNLNESNDFHLCRESLRL